VLVPALCDGSSIGPRKMQHAWISSAETKRQGAYLWNEIRHDRLERKKGARNNNNNNKKRKQNQIEEEKQVQWAVNNFHIHRAYLFLSVSLCWIAVYTHVVRWKKKKKKKNIESWFHFCALLSLRSDQHLAKIV
jgi:hypothetical protein